MKASSSHWQSVTISYSGTFFSRSDDALGALRRDTHSLQFTTIMSSASAAGSSISRSNSAKKRFIE